MRTSSSGKLKKVYFLKFHLIDELSSLAMTEEACFRGSHHIILAFQPNGDGEIRTLDPLLARQVLSQLSYTPIRFDIFTCQMGLSGLEPPTSRLSGVRSNQLSYKPVNRQPPAFPCRLQHSIIGRLGLNHRVRDVYGCFP